MEGKSMSCVLSDQPSHRFTGIGAVKYVYANRLILGAPLLSQRIYSANGCVILLPNGRKVQSGKVNLVEDVRITPQSKCKITAQLHENDHWYSTYIEITSLASQSDQELAHVEGVIIPDSTSDDKHGFLRATAIQECDQTGLRLSDLQRVEFIWISVFPRPAPDDGTKKCPLWAAVPPGTKVSAVLEVKYSADDESASNVTILSLREAAPATYVYGSGTVKPGLLFTLQCPDNGLVQVPQFLWKTVLGGQESKNRLWSYKASVYETSKGTTEYWAACIWECLFNPIPIMRKLEQTERACDFAQSDSVRAPSPRPPRKTVRFLDASPQKLMITPPSSPQKKLPKSMLMSPQDLMQLSPTNMKEEGEEPVMCKTVRDLMHRAEQLEATVGHEEEEEDSARNNSAGSPAAGETISYDAKDEKALEPSDQQEHSACLDDSGFGETEVLPPSIEESPPSIKRGFDSAPTSAVNVIQQHSTEPVIVTSSQSHISDCSHAVPVSNSGEQQITQPGAWSVNTMEDDERAQEERIRENMRALLSSPDKEVVMSQHESLAAPPGYPQPVECEEPHAGSDTTLQAMRTMPFYQTQQSGSENSSVIEEPQLVGESESVLILEEPLIPNYQALAEEGSRLCRFIVPRLQQKDMQHIVSLCPQLLQFSVQLQQCNE